MAALKPKPKPSANGHAAVRTEALELYDRGLWIVPVAGKRPVISEGWNERRLSRVELAGALERPHLGIALVLNRSPWIDVEGDTPEAEEALMRLFGGNVPPGPTWTSKRGRHRLFVRPEGLPERAAV